MAKVETHKLASWLGQYLQVDQFQDYAPNGLQVEASGQIKRLVFGVSASMELIQAAKQFQADGIVVHHGYFWKNENPALTHLKGKRIQELMKNNINLLAYHLPLDAHPKIGNNIKLAQLLGIKNPKPIPNSLTWEGDYAGTLTDLASQINQKLRREPLVIPAHQRAIKKIAWCTGAAQDFLEFLIYNQIQVDAFISGEISERTPLLARESGISYLAAGHHATERYGIEALCEVVEEEFNLDCKFIDIDNPA